MSVLAARRQAILTKDRNRSHSQHQRNHDFSTNNSGEQQLSLRTECEKNCTSNFTTRATAGCMRKCASLYKVDLTSISNNSNSKNIEHHFNSRIKYNDKDTNTIVAGSNVAGEELLDTEESQSTGLYLVHPRNRYAPNVPETKDLNSTNNFKNNYKNNVIENEVRQTSTEKIYSKYLSRSTLDNRHKRIDPLKLRQRSPSSSSAEKSVEDTELAPYLFFGQKLSGTAKLNEPKNQVTQSPRKTPLSSVYPTKTSAAVASKLDVEEFGDTVAVSKVPNYERNVMRRFNSQNRNIVTLNRKFGGQISRSEYEAILNLVNNGSAAINSTTSTSTESTTTLKLSESGSTTEAVIALNETKAVEELYSNNSNTSSSITSSSSISSNNTNNTLVKNKKSLDESTVDVIFDNRSSFSDDDELENPTLLIHVPDEIPVAETTLSIVTEKQISTTSTSTSTSTTTTSTTPQPTTSTPLTTSTPEVIIRPNFVTHRISHQHEETPNLIEFLKPNKTLQPPETTSSNVYNNNTVSTQTEQPDRSVSSSTSQTFTRTTISSSVRSTVNPIRGGDSLSHTNTTDNNSTKLSEEMPSIPANSHLPIIPDLVAIFSLMNSTKRKPSSSVDDILLSDNNDVTIEMHRMNLATYVLAGLGMFPIVVILLYIAKTVLFRRGHKSGEELEKYISDEHKKISPVVKLEQSQHHQTNFAEESSIITEESFNRNLLKFKSLLGEGNFGQVWKAEADDLAGHMGTTRIVAIKTERCGMVNGGLRSEATIMKKLGSHSNVVTLLGACTAKGRWKTCMYID